MKKKDFKNWNTTKEELHNEFNYIEDKRSFAILSQLKLFDIKRAKYKNGSIKENDFFKLQEKLLDLIVTPLEEPKGARNCDL